MNGNVSGFPKNVPRAEARILERVIQAMMAAMKKCAPSNGVHEANTPDAHPRAMAWGVARSLHKR
jgi:hypothetical protein